MISPRWKKVIRDLEASRGRMVMMVAAIAASIFAVGTVLSAYTILTREVSRNYLGTNPASAYLELERVNDSLVEAVRRRPSVLDAEAGSWVLAKIEIGANEWRPLLLFVVKDFQAQRINKVLPEAGAWPPPEQTLLLEREALRFVDARVGDTLTVQTPNGPKRTMAIAGSVHDPGLAPAWQEEMAYGYVTPSTLAWLGEGEALHILKVVVKNQAQDSAAVEATIGDLVQWLKSEGQAVGEIRIPPPLHPHQRQMNSVMQTLLIFSLLAVGLSAILTAAIIGGLLAQQIRQIGIMKAIGARTSQITGIYLLLLIALGLIAVMLGAPLGLAAGKGFAGIVAQLLNLNLHTASVPAWVFVVELLLGTLVPALAALGPIRRATRTTVRETLSNYGASRDNFGSRRLDSWLGNVRGIDNTLILALRNAFRRRGRLFLILSLLSVAGGLFMTGINVKAAWDRFLAETAAMRHYDLEIRLNSPQPAAEVLSTIAGIPGVRQIEPWSLMPVAVDRPDGLAIVRTYPDGGHGSLVLRSAPPESRLVDSAIKSGRLLQAGDAAGVVLNHTAARYFPNVKAGDTIHLTVGGRTAAFQVVGLVRQNLTPAAAYVNPEAFAAATGQPAGSLNGVRIVLDRHDANTISAVSGEIERALEARNVRVKVSISETMLEKATSGHIYVFLVALITMALIIAMVGALGLVSSMGTSVVERTREFGVMRAIGARAPTILRNVISEGVFIGLMSWVIAAVISLPLSLAIGNLIGSLSFYVPLGLSVSPKGLGIWFLVVALGSVAASAYPAWQASRLTVREALAYL